MATITIADPDVWEAYPATGFPMSLAELKRAQIRGPMYNFLRQEAFRDVMIRRDDFDRFAIDSTNDWNVANGGGAGAASFAINTQVNGVIRATTGTANGVTASASLIGPTIFPPTSNPGMEIRFKVVTANTGIRMEAGWIDAVPAGTTGGINSQDTPTAFMANGALVGIDTSATANNFNLVTIGSATNQVIKQTAGTVGLSTTGTYMTIRVQILSQDKSVANASNVVAWFNGKKLGTHDSSTTAGVGAVNGSVLLAVWVYFEAINATSKSLDIDYIATWADRGLV